MAAPLCGTEPPPRHGRHLGGRGRARAPVPAVLLGRLAVDRRHAVNGVGTALVAHVLATAVDLNASAACRAVVVRALNSNARRWWERLGFHPFDHDDRQHPDLYLLTAEIEKTLSQIAVT